MANISVLRTRLAEIETEFRGINEAAGEAVLNDEQQTRWDALDTELAEVRQGIADIEAAEARAARVAESRSKWNSLQVGGGVQRESAFDNLEQLRFAAPNDDAVRSRALKAFEGIKYPGARIKDEHRAALMETIETVDGAAAHALIHGSPEYMSAFRSWIRAEAQGRQPIYTPAEAEAVRASLSLTSANGGYLLPTALDPSLIFTGAMSKNPIRRISRVETGTTPVWNGVTAGNVTTYWKTEGSAFTDGSPTFGAEGVTAHMLTAYVTGSFEVFQDTNLLSQIPGLIGTAIDQAEGVAHISGSGSGAPYGIITAISATAGSTVTATTRGSFTASSGVDTLALYNSLATRYEDSATWVANKTTYLTIQQQVIGTYGRMLDEVVHKGTLLGSPIVKASSVTATTTSGNILAVLGDFQQYLIYDRLGVSVEFIQNVVDGDGLPVGKRALVAYKRTGADVTDVNGFRFLKA